jgi:hypothetical protein
LVASHRVAHVSVQVRADLFLVVGEVHQPTGFHASESHTAVLLQQSTSTKQGVIFALADLKAVGGVLHCCHFTHGALIINSLLWDVQVPSIGSVRKQQHKIKRFVSPVNLCDYLQTWPVSRNASAQNDILVDRFIAHQHGHFVESTWWIVATLVLASRTCTGADHQVTVLNFLRQDLIGHNEVLYIRIDLT